VVKINVNLYGGKSIFGGKETPLEADTIYCDRFDKCSFYADGKCLNCRSPFSPVCKFGKKTTTRGYTSRAAKYYDFKNQYKQDDCYNKLCYPSDLAAKIGDCLFLNLVYVRVDKRTEEDEKWKRDINGYIIENAGFRNGGDFIPISDITNELLYATFNYRPRAIMGGEIKDYQSKVVPDVLVSLKKCAPEIYKNFVAEHPKYDMEPNYVGKYAYIKTMVNGSTLIDCHGNKFILKDGKLVGRNIERGFVPFHGVMDCIVDVSETQTYKIDDNSQCNENTRFK